MRDHEIENKLAAYVQQATPDVLDSVLQQCDEQEGRVLPMSDIQQMNNHTKKRSWLVALSTGRRRIHSGDGFDYGISISIPPPRRFHRGDRRQPPASNLK